MPRKLKTIVKGDLPNQVWGSIVKQHVDREFDEEYFYPKPHAIALLAVLVRDKLKRKHIPPLDSDFAENLL